MSIIFRSFACVLISMSTLLAQIGASAQLFGTLTDPSQKIVENQIIVVRSLEAGSSELCAHPPMGDISS